MSYAKVWLPWDTAAVFVSQKERLMGISRGPACSLTSFAAGVSVPLACTRDMSRKTTRLPLALGKKASVNVVSNAATHRCRYGRHDQKGRLRGLLVFRYKHLQNSNLARQFSFIHFADFRQTFSVKYPHIYPACRIS